MNPEKPYSEDAPASIAEVSSASALQRSKAAYSRHRYRTPLFVLGETFSAFQLHNGLSLSASLSFYAMFALIPMALLMFFLLSHLVVSSDYAIVQLAILTSNLVPKLSQRIMIEVYNISQHKAVWGAFGVFALLWIATPLAAALRSAFYTIAAMVEAPSYIRRKFKDVLAVLGILLIFFLFTLLGLILQRILDFIHPAVSHSAVTNIISSLAVSTLLISLFYWIFFPARVSWQHVLIGSLLTAVLWMGMQPLFTLFLSLNQSYGTVFGSMKNLFISIAWLYYTFVVFLIGTELIATLRKKDILLLRNLLNDQPSSNKDYMKVLMRHFGRHFQQGQTIFHQGDPGDALYYIVSGNVVLSQHGKTLAQLESGNYFGEVAMLAGSARIADATVGSAEAEIVIINHDQVQTLLIDEPSIAMRFLKKMAIQLQSDHQINDQ